VIVCVCHRVSDRDIEREVRQGCDSFEALQDELRVATGCGRCADCARDTFDVALACRPAAAEVHAISDAREVRGSRVIPIAPASRAPLAA
jgi:bacterioferritin-associated ferredoxin